MRIDILFPAWRRTEFTRESLRQLVDTIRDCGHSIRMLIYTDEQVSDSCLLQFQGSGIATLIETAPCGGPNAILNHYNKNYAAAAEFIAKIDNDTIVPHGWLQQCIEVMNHHPELQILGLEPPASRTANPHSPRKVLAPEDLKSECAHPTYAETDSVGGLFFARSSVFAGVWLRPHGPMGVGGFGDWQLKNKGLIRIGWICPPLKLFLLDRLPFNPWQELSEGYIAAGQQRRWTMYHPIEHDLWEWWTSQQSRS